MHRCIAIRVHSIDVRAKVQQQFHRFQRFALLPRLFQRFVGPDARYSQQGCGAVGVGQQRIGTLRQQKTHQRNVFTIGREQERRRPFSRNAGRGSGLFRATFG